MAKQFIIFLSVMNLIYGQQKHITQSNPCEEATLDAKNDVEKWINNATIKADRNNISGKELTPFLIKEINEQSKNETLNANTSLIINNANLAGKIAKIFYS